MATPHALLITPNADIVDINLPTTPEHRLIVMRAALRCSLIDVVALTDRWDMWLDDEGIYNHHDAPNPVATALAQRFGHTHQRYHGPVLITGGADDEGDTLPLTRDSLVGLLTSLGGLTT